MTPTAPKPVRVRLAPSPTGHLHLGTARTALFNWLFARQQHGVFVLRIEDTDKERSKPEFEKGILEGLAWLGIDWDEGPQLDGSQRGPHRPYRQSERADIYRVHLERLLAEGKAYYCYCTKEELESARESMVVQGLPPRYQGHCRAYTSPPEGRKPGAIRFKMPEVEVEFKDLIRGSIAFNASLFGDIVIAKDLNTALYNFAVVVDDEEMKISHVIRGEDHIANTPKQILIGRALGFSEPEYAHLPLILSGDRSKLSKRYAETSLLSYRDAGYAPDALVNFLALLGWHPQGDQEIFSRAELIDAFSIRRIQKGGAVFNEEKLEWLNGQHLKQRTERELADALRNLFGAEAVYAPLFQNQEFLEQVIAATRERMKTLREFPELAGFFFELPVYDANLLVWKEGTKEGVRETLSRVRDILSNLPASQFTTEGISGALDPLIGEQGRGPVLWPFRVALSGRAASPDPIDIARILGKELSLERIAHALTLLDAS